MPTDSADEAELETTCPADELELVLVGPSSQGLAKGVAIGRVSVPPPINLDLEGLFDQAAHRLDKFLSSNGLKCESPEKRELLVEGLIARISRLSSKSQTWNRSDFVETLTAWVRMISPGFVRSLHESVLAIEPRSVRTTYSNNLIGRDKERQWLRETSGDRLIIGQPGIGKTFLLRDFVQEGRAHFLRSADENEIRRAVASVSPTAIVVEDAHLCLGTIEFLRRLRSDSGVTFDIIADCWPGSRDQVRGAMGIRRSMCRELNRVTDQDIVEIVKDCLINWPNSFLHMFVQQSAGFPGRAIMLVEACQNGTGDDLAEFWNGETLAVWVRSRFSQLLGRDSVQILACFAIGGKTGVFAERVAEALQLPLGTVRQMVADLAMGGIVVETMAGRIAVMPRSIRPVLVRDHFFGAVAIPYSTFLEDFSSFADVVATLVQASALGAQIPTNRLRQLVESANSRDTWEAFTYSSPQHASSVLTGEPHLIPSLADSLLRVIPEQTIPKLLLLSKGDERPLHAHPDHPLRQIDSWAKSGFPGRHAVKRRRTLLDAFRMSVDDGMEIDLALRLLPIIFSPSYENVENDPGNRDRLKLINGCLPTDDLRQISKFWDELLPILKRSRIANWKSVLNAVREWINPHFGSSASLTIEQREAITSDAAAILHSLTELAVDRPGVLRCLQELAEFHGIEMDCKMPLAFETLFPSDKLSYSDLEERKAILSILHQNAKALGKSWAARTPAEVISEINHWRAEADMTEHPWPNFTDVCCAEVSSIVKLQLPWIHEILSQNASADVLSKFLQRAIATEENGWEQCLKDCLSSDRYRYMATQLALTHQNIPDDILSLAIAEAPKAGDVINKTSMLNELADHVVCKLLSSTNDEVVRAAIEGMWHNTKKPPSDKPWYDEWRVAAARHLRDAYCLEGCFESVPGFRQEWLRNLCLGPSEYRYLEDSVVAAAADGLSEEDRNRLIDLLEPQIRHIFILIRELVGDFSKVYAHLLKNDKLKDFWATPLRRYPDVIWCEFVGMAMHNGVDLSDIVFEARSEFTSAMDETPKKFFDEIEVWQSLLKKVDIATRPIIERGLAEACDDLRDWELRERDEEL